MYSSAVLRDHDSHRYFRITFTLFQVTIPTSIHPVTVQPSALHPSIHVACTAPECTPISPLLTLPVSQLPGLVRLVRCTQCQSSVFELYRPSIRLMFNSSHNVTKRFPSRCFFIKSAGLTVPRIFSILSSWFLFLLQPKVLCFHMHDCAAPASESQSACCCSICPDSHLSFVSKLSYRVGQSDGLTRTAYHAVVTPRCSVTPLSVLTTKLPRCVDQRASILQMSNASSSRNQQRQHRRVHRSAPCSLLVAAGTPTRHVACRVGIVRYVSDE